MLFRSFIEAGADIVLIHIEVDGDIAGMLRRIRELGARPGITLNPATAAERVFDCLPLVDEVLCMTVNPGYGGQAFMAEVLPKIALLRAQMLARGLTAAISVDGGIDLTTAPRAVAAGANALIVGTALYRLADMTAGVMALRRTAQAAFPRRPA